MSFIRRGIETRAGVNYYSQSYNPLNLLYGQTSLWSSAGERVDEVTSLSIASVLSCVSLLADSVATMPLKCTVRKPDGGIDVVPTPEFLVNPDPANTNKFEYVHSTMISLALHGNAYTLISRDRSGNAIGLLPLHPYQVNVLADDKFNGRKYLFLGNEIPREDMLHIRWFTPPQSLVGISPILQQRTMLGLALAMDRYLAQWYGEGGTPSGVLETEAPLTAEAAKNLRDTWESTTRKRRRPSVLSHGLKWRPVQTSAVDMEFNATRDAVVAEIGRIFRIPPHMLGVKGDGMTYQNVEAASLNFLIHTLQPWLTRLEIAFSTLIPDPNVNVHFDPAVLLRLDALTKARVELTRIQSGTLTANEARIDDGRSPYQGGDQFFAALPGAPITGETEPIGESDG